MRVHTFILILISSYLLVSCETEIEIPYQSVSKYVVVNSNFCPNKPFEVNLSFTRSIFDNQDEVEYIEDAIIRFYRGDGAYLFTPYYDGNGNYKSNVYPIENQVYNVEIEVEGYETISASSRIPTQAIVDTIITTDVEQDGETFVKVDFEIEDSEESDNYYIWEVTSENLNSSTNPNSYNINQGLQTLGPSEVLQNNGTWSKLFIQEMNLTQAISFISFHDQPQTEIENPEIPVEVNQSYLKLISASYDYYNYLYTLEIYNNNKAVLGNSINALPTEVHSNINGGLGIFAGYNEQYIKL